VCARWGERSAGIASHVARAIAFASWTFSTVDDSKFRPMKAQQACNSTSEERANKTSKKKAVPLLSKCYTVKKVTRRTMKTGITGIPYHARMHDDDAPSKLPPFPAGMPSSRPQGRRMTSFISLQRLYAVAGYVSDRELSTVNAYAGESERCLPMPGLLPGCSRSSRGLTPLLFLT
jgi:hypothetical protein